MNNQPKTIKLTQGYEAIVDAEDYEELNKHKWCYLNAGYAVRRKTIDGKWKFIYMHRVINKTPDGLETDHINNNALDNRRDNLRTTTRSQNAMNQTPQRNCSSRFRGVGWYKRHKKWRAKIKLNGKSITIGYYDDEYIAARAYNKKAKELFGEFAYSNIL